MSDAGATLGAAAIAGAVALVGLILSKENKVSEFRQQWIDGLRDDLSAFIATATILHRGGLDARKAEDLLLRLQELNCRIRLRFKSNDEDSKELIAFLNGMAANVLPSGNRHDFIECEGFLREAAQQLLKQEWEVVKRGETTYRVVLRTALAVLVLSVAAIFGWLIHYAWTLR